MPCEGRKLLPKVISWARNFRCATNHFDCAGRALFHSRDWAGIDHAYDYDRNFYRSEYRYSSCSRPGSLSVAIAPVHCPFGIDLATRSDEHGDYGDRFIPNAPVERPHDVKTLGRSFYSGQAKEKTARKRSLVSWD
jgi:hypothetical protein